MKKILLSLIALVCCMSMSAQTMKIYKNGTLVNSYTQSEADSVVFEKEHEYVDLGLPSGTLWATCNVGASNPEDDGLYFSWGDTTGYGSDTTDGFYFNWTSYKWCNGSSTTMTKYCTSINFGVVDNEIELVDADDAATVNWNKLWCTPTYIQYSELVNSNYTKIDMTTLNGVYGMSITSLTNGKSIFLPAVGYRGENKFINRGKKGYYWSRSLSSGDSYYAYSLQFINGGAVPQIEGNRCHGLCIRPVRTR